MGNTSYICNGRYELLEVAGRGGMAVVWRSIQNGNQGFQRIVAVKQMHEHLCDIEIYINMFSEEARVSASLQSPNIAHVYDFIKEDGKFYLVLEWIDGIDLSCLISYFTKRGLLVPWEVCAAVGVGTLRALADAHERLDIEGKNSPILHRDISPRNILITTRGMVKLIDFGLCLAGDRKMELTEPGVVKGKMSYLCPEIVAGGRPTIKSDQFSVGSVLWESLAGKKLFDGATDYDIYSKIRDGKIAPIRGLRRDVPRSVSKLLRKSLAMEPEQRFEGARMMGQELSKTLKSSRAVSDDLHQLMARLVVDARFYLEMGDRTGNEIVNTPVADVVVDQIDLPSLPTGKGVTPSPTGSMALNEETSTQGHGLLHRLPFFGHRK